MYSFEEFLLERKKRKAKKAKGALGWPVLTGSDGLTHLAGDLTGDGKPVSALGDGMTIQSILSVDTDMPAGGEISAGSVAEKLNALQADWNGREVKTGEYLYLTALLRPRNAEHTYTPNEIGVIKVRVVDVYRGLQALKYAQK